MLTSYKAAVKQLNNKRDYITKNKQLEISKLISSNEEQLRTLLSKHTNSIELMQNGIKDLESKIEDGHLLEDKKLGLLKDIEKYKLDVCGECGSPKSTTTVLLLTKQVHSIDHTLSMNQANTRGIASIRRDMNRDINNYNQLIKAKSESLEKQIALLSREEDDGAIDMAKSLVKSTELEIKTAQTKLSTENSEYSQLRLEISDTEELSHILVMAKEILMKNTIQFITTKVNQYLSTYFNGIFKLELNLTGKDSIDIVLYKDTTMCQYGQLSKGQRQVVKLCFTAAIMGFVSDYSSVKPSVVFFDEALDGMDTHFKLQSIKLLETLPYENIFVVEHSEEVKTMVDRKLNITFKDDRSSFEQPE